MVRARCSLRCLPRRRLLSASSPPHHGGSKIAVGPPAQQVVSQRLDVARVARTTICLPSQQGLGVHRHQGRNWRAARANHRYPSAFFHSTVPGGGAQRSHENVVGGAAGDNEVGRRGILPHGSLWRQHVASLRRGRTGIPVAAARDLANVGRPVHLPLGLWLAAQEPGVSAHFAPSSREFRECANMFPAGPSLPFLTTQKPSFMTNAGFHISLNLFRHPGGMYAVLPVQDDEGWLLAIPLLGPDRIGVKHLKDIEERHDQPLALFKADRLHAGNLIMRTLVIVQNASLPLRIRPSGTMLPNEVHLDLDYPNDIEITEHFAPALRESRDRSVALLSLRRLMERQTLPLSILRATSVTKALYFRTRVSRGTGQPSEEFVVKLTLDRKTGDVRNDGIWEWNSFRGQSTAPSLAALLLSGEEEAAGRREKTSRGIRVSVGSQIGWNRLCEPIRLGLVAFSPAENNELE